MSQLEVTDKTRMRRILETFAILDQIRWSHDTNYNLINYCVEDLTADEKLLTHWLCYIVDRQTPFRRIWDVGGYVISHLVHTYTSNDGAVDELLKRYIHRWEDHGRPKVRLECELAAKNSRLERRDITEGPVRFASRFMPEDLLLIFRTLFMLDKLTNRSLAGFIAQACEGADDPRTAIRQIAAALFALTYAAGGNVSAQQLDASIKSMGQKSQEDAKPYLNDRTACIGRWTDAFCPSGKKRLWCSLRDYLKSPEFSGYFVVALRKVGVCDADRWCRGSEWLRKGMDVIELPGDVWNNRPIFRGGLFSPYLENEKPRMDMPRVIRTIYEIMAAEDDLCFYPEQLDVTFDFVPLMCERQMCDICLFGNGISLVCHQKPELICPVALASCGYYTLCEPENCGLKHDQAEGLCMNSTGSAS